MGAAWNWSQFLNPRLYSTIKGLTVCVVIIVKNLYRSLVFLKAMSHNYWGSTMKFCTWWREAGNLTLYTLTSQKHSTKVPHHLWVTKLQQYGVSCSALQWFASYLSKRYQRVVLDGAFSDWLTVTSGVPQGSVLGPLLFPVYMLQLVFLISGSICFSFVFGYCNAS